MATQVHVEPAHNHGHGRVCAHAHQKEGGVLDLRIVVDCQQNGEPRDGEADGPDGVGEAMAGEVAEDGDEHGKAKGDGPGWDAVELGLDGVVVICGDDGGAEIGVSVGWSVKRF